MFLAHPSSQDACCAKASSAQLALRALQRAKDAKLQPNAMTYNAVGMGRWEDTRCFFWRHRTLDDTCDADTITINHQITIYHHKVIKDDKW